MTSYSYQDDLSPIFVGRSIVEAEFPVGRPTTEGGKWYATEPTGRLTLDDGTQVYVAGNEGGCSCSAGCYYLTHVAKVDNIITSVKVENDGQDDWGDSGTYRIFVVTEASELSVAEFDGDDGGGYYGSGFHLYVIPGGDA